MGDNFHHHPDNICYIRTSQGIYQDKLDNFKADMRAINDKYNDLPDGYNERYYEPSKKHCLATRDTDFPQKMPWKEGDRIISKYDQLKQAQKSRQEKEKKE